MFLRDQTTHVARSPPRCRGSDEAVAVGEDLVGPKGGEGDVNAGRGWAPAGGLSTGGPRATSPLCTSLTRARAARTSWTPYGDRFSAMAARSVGVHLSAGASLTWAERSAGL